MSKFLEDIKWQWEMKHSFSAEKWEMLIKKLEEAEQLQAEIDAIKLKMQIHAGDICSMNNENERFIADKYEAEERADKLQTEVERLKKNYHNTGRGVRE